jgi:subtilisin family serine protease
MPASLASVSSDFRIRPLAGAICAVFCLGLALPLSAAGPAGDAAAAPATAAVGERVRYVVVLKGEPLATYRGGVAGLAAAPRLGAGRKAGRLDVNAAAAQAYAAYLAQRQADFLQAAGAALGRPLEAVATLQHALNAVIVELDEAEAARIAQRGEVDFVERDRELQLLTDRGPSFIGAPSIWDGSASNGVASRGEGVVVGIIDSGVNWQSPAFAGTGPKDGYVHVNPRGAGNYLGLCGPTPPNADLGRCNDKLIGMYDFTTTSATRSATDHLGHGSHTASTVAGNQWDAPFGGGTFTISGVAPHANVIAYRVCTSATSCSGAASVQSVNQAIVDGVDVLNYSISGGTSPWSDSVAVAFRNAVDAGIFVAASAGNSGPDPGSLGHIEPWVETVAASTKDNVVGFRFNLTGPGTPPSDTQNLPLRPAAPPLPTDSIVDAPIVRSPTFANGSSDGCSAFPADTFTAPAAPDADVIFADGFDPATPPARVGAIAVLALDQNASNCGSGARRTAALNAGAIGVIFVDRDFINLGANNTSWSMLRADWDKAWAAMQADPAAATASLLLPAASFPQRGDVVADFSGRGPLASSGQYVIKPDITAPGVDILAAYTADLGGANATALENGTSMSSPHIAGSAALLRAVRPDWTPTQIRSAMNMTAKFDGLIRADGSATDAWDLGSGRVDLTRAALSGVVLDETTANFIAANPASGGTLASLNLASMASASCATTCTFTRTLTSTSLASKSYTLSFTGLPAGATTVTPATFTLAAGATQTITISIDGTTLASGWNFGRLVLDADDVLLPSLHMPIAIRH